MSKWKIQHEEFNDRTPKGRIKKSRSDESIEKQSFSLKTNKSAEYRELFYQVHKYKYDYSKVPEVFSVKEKVTVICPLHGEFQISPEKHVGKGKHLPRGCRQCRDGYKAVGNPNVSIYYERYDVSKVIRLIETGWKTSEIASEMDLRTHIVKRIASAVCNDEQLAKLKSNNRIIRESTRAKYRQNNTQKISDEVISKMVELAGTGMTVTQIALEVSSAKSTVKKYLKQANVCLASHFVTDEMEQTMVRLSVQGMTHKQISEEIGLSIGTVGRYLRRNSISGMRSKVTSEVLERIMQLSKQGMTHKQIALETGLQHQTVGEHLRKNNIKRRVITEEAVERVTLMSKQGMNRKQISDASGLNYDAVRRIFKKYEL